MEMPGMVHNKLSFAVQRPCLDCFITSFKPDLVYGDGTKANLDSGPMLHHAVFTSQFRSDAVQRHVARSGGRALLRVGQRAHAGQVPCRLRIPRPLVRLLEPAG